MYVVILSNMLSAILASKGPPPPHIFRCNNVVQHFVHWELVGDHTNDINRIVFADFPVRIHIQKAMQAVVFGAIPNVTVDKSFPKQDSITLIKVNHLLDLLHGDLIILDVPVNAGTILKSNNYRCL
ncbi:hypothetical protein PR003_g28870 [Phytophthora rubi]|uniref:Uncharacterized protein n=1 Tax=Phytophthora rubi TaxID=129364 RepID=A0A6A4BN78_9STRA|nr:hypothetical protein PR003_g28870 [Phytophthora rubi]